MIGMYGLFATAVLLDTLGTTLFKLGANRSSLQRTTPAASFNWHTVRSFFIHWQIPLGLAVYVVEYIIWIAYLSSSSLSRAFPMYSITIVLILIVSRFFLKEQIGKNRWLGAALIVAGVLMLGGNE
jgi:drug/metabolite transporter (DMT)-like permease